MSNEDRIPLNQRPVPAPELTGIVSWLNTPGGKGMTLEELRGKVVLVDFWTYSCINCIRTLPHLVEWDRKYRDQGLVIIGVHTPEFAFEKDRSNVEQALLKYGITYPVALDNDYATWNAYRNQFWPAKYFIDSQGQVVWQHFGEGKYEETERVIQQLLRDAKLLTQPVAVSPETTTVDFRSIGTPETYIGYLRAEGFGSGVVQRDQVAEYVVPETVYLNSFYLGGSWLVGQEQAELVRGEGRLTIRYRAKVANIVFDSDALVRARVLLDGQPLTTHQLGADVALVDGESSIDINGPRLYHLVETPGYEEHTLEVFFPDPGVRAFAFTFG